MDVGQLKKEYVTVVWIVMDN